MPPDSRCCTKAHTFETNRIKMLTHSYAGPISLKAPRVPWTGHAGIDCSKCGPGFSSTRRNSQSGHGCHPCPGVLDAGICNNRGLCVDDTYVQTAAASLQPAADLQLLRGNGSCLCNPNFFGEAALLRVSADEASCRICRESHTCGHGDLSGMSLCRKPLVCVSVWSKHSTNDWFLVVSDSFSNLLHRCAALIPASPHPGCA